MKRILFAILLLALSFPMSGQDTIQQEERVMPKDSLPDLWVITLDISGSMKGEQKYSKIPDGFKAIVEKNGGNKTNNRFILLGSGMTFDELRSSHEGFAKKFDLHYVVTWWLPTAT